MINKVFVAVFVLILTIGCGQKETADVIAEAGNSKLTREEFQKLTGQVFDSLSAEQRLTKLAEWVDLAMIEQEMASTGVHDEPELAAQAQRIVAEFYRAVLLARQPVPVITDSLIADYFNTHQTEFKRPSDSYLIESFYCESDDSLKAFRRALERADTSRLKSGFVIWEGKWLAAAADLEPPLLLGVRATQAGGLTQVLPFGEGFRLIRVDEIYPEGSQLSLEAVRGEVRERLLTEQSQRRQERWENDLRNRYQPKIMGESK